MSELKIKIFFRHPRVEYNSIEELFETVLGIFSKEVHYDRIELPFTGASFKAIFWNMKHAWAHRGRVNHITGDVHYIGIVTGSSTVLTIHDAYSALRGSFFKKLMIRILWFWLPALFVKKIITISPKSKKELEHIIPFAKRKIKVIPNPYNPRVLLSANNIEGQVNDAIPIVFLLGTKSNKNLERTIEALGVLSVKLIILGKLSLLQRKLLERFNVAYEDYFNVPFSVVGELYGRCDLVCFASLYEGFGMPVLEGQLVGKPIVTSDIEPLNWVAGAGACLVDPLDVDSIREGVRKVLNNNAYRQQLIQAGKENVLRFEPGIIAQMYEEVYEEVERDRNPDFHNSF